MSHAFPVLAARLARGFVACAALAFLTACATNAGNPAAPAAAGFQPADLDPAVRPQDDLFRHVNGRWIDRTPIPPDKSDVGALDDIFETTRARLRTLIETAASGKTTDADARKVGDLYASFMDEAAVEKAGLGALAGELAAIDAVSAPAQLPALFARLDRLGAAMPFGAYVGQDDKDSTRYLPTLWQGGLGLPDRDYYLQTDDAKFRDARLAYQRYLSQLLALGGGTPAAEAAAMAERIVALETALARIQRSRVENRDPQTTYNKFAVSGLKEMAPGIDWPGFLSAAGLAGKSTEVLAGQPAYLRALGDSMAATPLATWKAYARAQLLQAYAPYLGKAYVDARFAYVGTALGGATEISPRWKRGVTLVDGSIGEALGRVYVDAYFPPAYKARMETLVANLLSAYKSSIATLDWMSPQTQRAAQVKLAKFSTKIGYPKRWIDYSRLDIRRDDLVGNVMRARAFEADRQIAKLGKPVDRDEWGMTPQTVNAYYNSGLNEIVFPAAFLQKPTFDPDADDAVNYGAIGAVIGHEISHGFDDSGSQYDGDGNLRDWWTDADRQRFKEKTAALVAQYAAFSPVPGYHVDGELTLGENIADNSGLAIAFKAYHLSLGGKPAPVLDGKTGDQRFYIGWAQAWRSKQRPESLLSQIKSDPHSPEEFRVDGTVRNQPGFYEAFGVKPGDKLYLPPAARVIIW